MAEQELEKDFVEYVVKAIVDNPDQVKVEKTVDERGVLLSLTVAPDDMGQIIGREGRTAKAIRTLLRVFGAKNDSRINLKVVEPEGSERPVKATEPAPEGVAPETVEAAEPEVPQVKEEAPEVEAPPEEAESTKAAKQAAKEAAEAADLEI